MERQNETYKIVMATTYNLGSYEEFVERDKKDSYEGQDWSICTGAIALLDSLSFEEALEAADKISDEEIFCEAQYFLDYVTYENLVVFESTNDFCSKANLDKASVIYKLSTGKVIQIFK